MVVVRSAREVDPHVLKIIRCVDFIIKTTSTAEEGNSAKGADGPGGQTQVQME